MAPLNRHARRSGQQAEGPSAFVNEQVVPGELTVDTDETPGAEKLFLRQFVGPVGHPAQRTFMFCHTASLTAETAIAVGETLVEAGRALKTGLVTATADQIPAGDGIPDLSKLRG